MTAKLLFDNALKMLSKVNAPSMLLEDFNYFINKAVYQYVNKRYNIYDVNQQTTDDIRVLKATTILDAKVASQTYNDTSLAAGYAALFSGTYELFLPLDYLHMLNCVCIYKLNSRYKCYNQGDHVQFAAKRLTADSWSTIINDYYNRPLPWRPYYYIHNVNTSLDIPTNVYSSGYDVDENGNQVARVNTMLYRDSTGTDVSSNAETEYTADNGSNDTGYTAYDNQAGLPRTIHLSDDLTAAGTNTSLVNREAGFRYGNATSVRCEIRYGNDNSVFELEKVLIDYIKAPQEIRLTQEQVDLIEDVSQQLEFPDYVCDQIINELVILIMENTADPRL